MKQLKKFKVIGITVRTINNGQAGKDIKHLWDKFMSHGCQAIIPNKLSEDLYSIYTNYETDHTNFYDFILGCKVSSLTQIPEGMTGITIPKANYQIFTSKGMLPNSVLETWTKIWNTPITRAYQADFEIYTPKSWNPKTQIVKTYLSINP